MTPGAGKAALITGAGRRIGAEIARALAADGWRVVIHYLASRDAAETVRGQIEAAGGQASLVQADLALTGGPGRLMDEVRAIAPELELVVNNASDFPHDTAQTTDDATLARCFSVNATAPILLAQSLAATLPDGRGGVVVNILDNRVFAPNPDFFSYGVSKHALLGATRMLALALAPRVRVNAIAPGIALTSGRQTEQNFATAHGMNPLQRGCTPAEIANAVRFIAASPAMTGAVITIDGGQSLANPGRDVQFLVED